MFSPPAGWRNPHIQTVLGNALRDDQGITFRRERWETADGDFLDIDFADVVGHSWAALGDSAPLGLVLHGLEGSARRGYMCEMYRQLARQGVRPVGMNYRSCSGELNRGVRMYHAGATADVLFVLQQLLNRFTAVPLALIGFSLGGNMCLKLLGELENDEPRLVVGAAVSPPLNMNIGSAHLEQGFGLIYGYRFVQSLQAKVAAKSDLLTAVEPPLNLEKILACTRLTEFDNELTAPLFGYRDAGDYYTQCSSGRFLPSIQRPTLIIRALDDPLISYLDIPHEHLANNPHLTTLLPEHGGHVGFVERRLARWEFWAERTVAGFVADHLFG